MENEYGSILWKNLWKNLWKFYKEICGNNLCNINGKWAENDRGVIRVVSGTLRSINRVLGQKLPYTILLTFMNSIIVFNFTPLTTPSLPFTDSIITPNFHCPRFFSFSLFNTISPILILGFWPS